MTSSGRLVFAVTNDLTKVTLYDVHSPIMEETGDFTCPASGARKTPTQSVRISPKRVGRTADHVPQNLHVHDVTAYCAHRQTSKSCAVTPKSW